jgi:ribosomal protein L37AE/L43A
MRADPGRDDMKCPKCGRFDLRESPEGVRCRICGYALSPGEVDKFRLFRLLKQESKGKR